MSALRTFVFVCVAVVLVPASALALDDLPGALGAMGYGEQWIGGFDRRWTSLQARVAMPAETVRMVLSMLEPGDLAADPAEAALELYQVVRAVERQRLGGEPLWRIRLRLEQELRQGGRGVAGLAKKVKTQPASRSAAGDGGRSGGNTGKGKGSGSPDGEAADSSAASGDS